MVLSPVVLTFCPGLLGSFIPLSSPGLSCPGPIISPWPIPFPHTISLGLLSLPGPAYSMWSHLLPIPCFINPPSTDFCSCLPVSHPPWNFYPHYSVYPISPSFPYGNFLPTLPTCIFIRMLALECLINIKLLLPSLSPPSLFPCPLYNPWPPDSLYYNLIHMASLPCGLFLLHSVTHPHTVTTPDTTGCLECVLTSDGNIHLTF